MSSQKHLQGIHVDHCKNTEKLPIVPMTLPDKVFIPMIQHIGAPCQPTVTPGDHVKVGQVIGDNPAPVCAPIHASASGDVTAVKKIMTAMGRVDTVVEITLDKKQEPADNLAPPTITNKEEFLAAVRAAGLVGLGGAAFPTHIKYNPKDPVDTLILNGAECEPYITVDHRTMLEHTEEILNGAKAVVQHLGLKNCAIAIESNKPDAIAKFEALVKDIPGFSVCALSSQYPQGAERVLIYEATGRVLPAGRLPAEVGTIVSNINSVLKLNDYLTAGRPLTTKSLTVDGNAITEPKNVEVLIGTPIKDIIAFCGGYKLPPRKILMGGPMMGRAIPSDEMCILKGNNAILAFDDTRSQMSQETACINCGRCVRTCPTNLMPTLIYKAYELKDLDELRKLHATACMECGCCTYVCPAKKQLSFINKLAKAYVMAEGGKK